MRFLLGLLLTVACSSPSVSPPDAAANDATTTPDAPTDAGSDAGATTVGTVTNVQSTKCTPAGQTSGTPTCQSITVSCDGAAPLVATVLDIEPKTTAVATVFIHDGGGGTGFYSSDGLQPGRLQLVNELWAMGYRVVEISWASDWEAMGPDGGSGSIDGGVNDILAAACRPATAFAWAFDNVHVGGHASPYCGLGHSAGSGAIGYSLGHYGLDAYFDYVVLSQGPPFGRIDCGCDTNAPECTPPNLCNIDGGVPIAYTPGAAAFVGRDETSPGRPITCGTPDASTQDIAYWRDTSVLSSPTSVNLHYPNTGVSAWFCVNSNETLGLGSFYVSQIESLGGTASVQCVAANGDAGCALEPSGGTEDDIDGYLPDGGTAIAGIAGAIQQGCVVHH